MSTERRDKLAMIAVAPGMYDDLEYYVGIMKNIVESVEFNEKDRVKEVLSKRIQNTEKLLSRARGE